MEEEEGGGVLKKKNTLGTGEVDFKEKSGTAWSHNFLNQKPWHPLSYPNQRRKWIAEQTDAQRQRRAEEVAREFAQEQEFYRQTALVSKKEKEKVEIMKAVSFMYVRPPGYNAESAKAAEIEDERRRLEGPSQVETDCVAAQSSMPSEDKKKSRPKDVFGRALPTEEEFEVLKNAPRLETGLPARPKPFGIEIRNVKCLRCGNFGHQSGDRECLLKDAITSNEENRLKRDDPLTSMMALADTSETLKWELKQKPGMSPPRGGFNPDDPNQQIVAEDIFDEYGGFLNGGGIPDLLANFKVKKSKKHSKSKIKQKGQSSNARNDPEEVDEGESSLPLYSDSDVEKISMKRKMKESHRKRRHRPSSDHSDSRRHRQRTKDQHVVSGSSDDSEAGKQHKRSKNRGSVPDHSESRSHRQRTEHPHVSSSSDDSEAGKQHKRRKNRGSVPDHSDSRRHRQRTEHQLVSSSSDDSEAGKHHKRSINRGSVPDDDRHRKQNTHRSDFSFNNAENDKPCERSKQHSFDSSDDVYYDRHHKRKKHRRSASPNHAAKDKHHRGNKQRGSVSPDDSYYDRHGTRKKHHHSSSLDDSDTGQHHKTNKYCQSASLSDSDCGMHCRRNKHKLCADDRHKKRDKQNTNRRHRQYHSDRYDAR